MSDVLALWRDHAKDPKAHGGFANMPTEDLRVIMDTLATLTAENARLSDVLDKVKQQAAIWKQEARTQKHTVDGVGAALGGVPDYGPIVQTVADIVAENARLLEDAERLDCRTIRLPYRDEWGELAHIVYGDIDLRVAIDTARAQGRP